MTRMRSTMVVVAITVVLNGLSAAGASVLLLRSLGSVRFGEVGTAIIVGNSLAALVSAAPTQSLYTLVGADTRRSTFFGISCRRDGLGVTIVTALAGLLLLVVAPSIGRAVLTGSCLVLPIALAGFHVERIRLLASARAASIWNCSRAVGAWSASVIIAVATRNSAATVAAYGLAAAVAATASSRQFRTRSETDLPGPLPVSRRIALPAIASSYALTFADRLFVVQILGQAPLGLYSFAYQLGEGAITLAFLPVTFVATVPVVARWAEGPIGRRAASRMAASATGLVLGAAAAFEVGLFFVARTNRWGVALGQDHASATVIAQVAAIIVPGVALAGLTRIPAAILTRMGRARLYTRLSVTVLAVTLVATGPVTYWGGVRACAAVTTVAYTTLFLVTWLACARLDHVNDV